MRPNDERPGDPLETDPDHYGRVPKHHQNENVVERKFDYNFNPNPGNEDPEILKGYRVIKRF